jgi:hypothetical protein
MVVDDSRVVTATAEGGPTDAFWTLSWWEVELIAGGGSTVTHVRSTAVYDTKFFASRINDISTFSVPSGQNWVGKRARFVIQAVTDAQQIWRSNWLSLSDPNFNNGAGQIKPLPAGPVINPGIGPVIGPPGAGVVRKRTFDFSTRR